ncbi:MAG: DNA polymerase-3 subunit delta' [Pseudohongiellaceae bacterium]|jgi:DNA polymerase-3 subunit delta'
MTLSVDAKQSLLHEIPFPWQQAPWSQIRQQHESGSLAHAYLVYGEPGLGKALFAEALALSILCTAPTPQGACGKCSVCQLGQGGSLPDLFEVAPEDDSREIKIAQIRKVTGFIAKSSHGNKGKVVIVDSAHCLNNAAANALLKTLEEPSQTTYLFLVTSLPGALSATIRSRCQRIKIDAPTAAAGKQWLEAHTELDEAFAAGMAASTGTPLLCLKPGAIADPAAIAVLLKGLVGVLEKGEGLRELISHGSKQGELVTIGYLEQVSTILIKYLLTNSKPPLMDAGAEAVASALLRLGKQPVQLGAILLGYQQELQKARRQLLSTSNPNPQLIMESLLWRWSLLFKD